MPPTRRTPPHLPYDLHSAIVHAAIERRHTYTFSEDETDDLAANRRLLHALCRVSREFRSIAQPLLFAEAVFQRTSVFPRDAQEEERPFLYFDAIECNPTLGAHVRHILVQNGSAQISSAILSYLHLLPNVIRLSTLCWHLDLPLPEDVLEVPLRKPSPHSFTVDLARFASPSYRLIVDHWFDFSQLRKLHLRNAHHVDYVLDAFLPLLTDAKYLTDLRIDGFGTTAHESRAMLTALKQLGHNLRTLHLQSLGTPATLSAEVLALCPRLEQLSTHVADVSPLLASPHAHANLQALLVGHIPRPFKPTHDTLQANFATLSRAVEQLLPVFEGRRFPALRLVGSGGLDFGRVERDRDGEMSDVWAALGQRAGELGKVGLRLMDRYGEVLETGAGAAE